MESTVSTISTLKTTVLSIESDVVTLQIDETGQTISWPKKDFSQTIEVGNHYSINLGLDAAQSIEQTVRKAQKQDTKNLDSMRKLLEELIN